MQEIIDLLENDARLSPQDIAAMTGKSEEEVRAAIKKLEDEGIILKYAAVINRERLTSSDTVSAMIEIQVAPAREHGFDRIAERIYRYPQVKTVQLMSGGYDLHVLVEGKDLKEVAFFVSAHVRILCLKPTRKTERIISTRKKIPVKRLPHNGQTRSIFKPDCDYCPFRYPPLF